MGSIFKVKALGFYSIRFILIKKFNNENERLFPLNLMSSSIRLKLNWIMDFQINSKIIKFKYGISSFFLNDLT